METTMALSLSKILQHENQNVAELLDEQMLGTLSARCYEEYELDWMTLADWRAKTEEALKIAQQIWEKKSHPWPGASNVKYPLIAGASMQFAARAYPNIISGTEIVRTKVIGRDLDGQKWARAQRVQKHLNYQLCEQMSEWEEDMDKLLHGLPVLGSYFKKTYFSPIRQRPISDLCPPQDVTFNNNVARLEDLRRISHCFTLYKNDILERQRASVWLDKDLKLTSSGEDEQGPYICLEQHRWLDLDEDGYEEPYVVTLVNSLGLASDGTRNMEGGDIVRIVPRYFVEDIALNSSNKVVAIRPQQVFSKFDFLPDLCGKLMGVGFGQLLLPINESINTIINQLIDAGTINNLQSGFLSKQLKIKGGRITLEPGEWKQIDALTQDLRGAILPIPTKEPSLVLFQLLGMLTDAGKQLSSVSEVLSGEQSGVNVPATTTLALIEQGLKVFSSINKRIYRALKSEFNILYQINSRYLEDQEYFRVLDEEQLIARQDYATGDADVYPLADPSISTDIQKLIKAEALMKTIGVPGSADPRLIVHKYYEALKVEDLERFHPEQAQEQPPPPEAQDIMAKIKEREAKLPHEIERIKSESTLNFAKADAENAAETLEQLRLKIDTMMQMQQQAEQQKQAMAQQAQQAQQQAAQQAQGQQEGAQANALELMKLAQSGQVEQEYSNIEREKVAQAGQLERERMAQAAQPQEQAQ